MKEIFILKMLDQANVLIYGTLIMVFFLNIKLNKKNITILLAYTAMSLILKAQLYYNYNEGFIEKLYPFMIHIPLIIFFSVILKKRLNLVLFVLFSAYIFTAPRRWIGELVASYFNNDIYVLVITKIIISVILLFVIYKYVRPYIKDIMNYSNKRINMLTIVPAIYYILTYATTVYTEVLYKSNILVDGLFSVGFNFILYIFIIAYSIEMDKSFGLQMQQGILKLEVDAMITQIEDYKKAQMQDAIYRHDLRHHLQFISTSISENHLDEALEYISKINKLIETTHIIQICQNTSVNLILSAYKAKAESANIDMEISAIVPKSIPMEVTDVCVILGNGIENAMNACKSIVGESNKKVRIICKFANNKLMIEICNSFEGEITFEDNTPITTKKNHGLGVKSIIATVNKYKGICSFEVENRIFIMRAVL